ncbi:hypothetical protein [Nonomuraea cavernae]|uniref:Uncharacterized protein n=1 Tax=Nonomuraea cavernae TaxID=2045107 RepID=A0A917Z3H6_9ACTN|nr:hypothetical protein [Nonomuraea cavernae]MCA2188264.1 hypothetical protein [Nonomuraea cavernae]GGO73824.1 hypothetical protein GCM10012289_45050 [Nonomuraea cavernae]
MRTATRLSLAVLIVAVLPLAAMLLLPARAGAWPDSDDPLTMSVDRISCRSGRVSVALRNRTRHPARFDLRAGSSTVISGTVDGHDTVRQDITVDQGDTVRIRAYSVEGSRDLIGSARAKNDCPQGWRRQSLPHTGPPLALIAKLATAVALLLTGGILWWYGSIWPGSCPPGSADHRARITPR